MFVQFSPRMQDLQIRLGGLLLVTAGVLAIHSLFQLAHTGGPHEATAIEGALAIAGFLSLSLGSALLAHGGHLLDHVVVSMRWVPRYDPMEGERWQRIQ